MKKFILLICFLIITCPIANSATQVYYDVTGQPSYMENYGPIVKPMAGPYIQPPKIYPQPGIHYRTGYSRPNKRYAQPKKRLAKPITRLAHKRPDYIYTSDYQNKVKDINQNPSTEKTKDSTISRFDKNYQITQTKKVSCGGITYYGIQNLCK